MYSKAADPEGSFLQLLSHLFFSHHSSFKFCKNLVYLVCWSSDA